MKGITEPISSVYLIVVPLRSFATHLAVLLAVFKTLRIKA